ncbi:MAG TPA: hypothetical protein VFX45_09965 [Solirubrobacterales bacterium]|nr:hypothetical protein [Solirubrobacterales bacterium]
MSSPGPAPVPARDPLPRLFSFAALFVALIALVFSMGGLAPAAKKGQVVVLGKGGKIPAKYLPIVKTAKNAKKLGGATREKLSAACPIPNAIDLGTWCLESGLYPVPPKDTGKNDYLYATQACVKAGGWLPSAAQLIGAAPRAKLQSTIDDSILTSGAEEFPDAKNGIKDKREMSGDLTTVASGSRSAGSEGVTVGSKGVGNLGEPDPVPMPADPLPETLNYVTVYDNHNLGGFAGGAPVGKAENFRCAYAKGSQGRKFGD